MEIEFGDLVTSVHLPEMGKVIHVNDDHLHVFAVELLVLKDVVVETDLLDLEFVVRLDFWDDTFRCFLLDRIMGNPCKQHGKSCDQQHEFIGVGSVTSVLCRNCWLRVTVRDQELDIFIQKSERDVLHIPLLLTDLNLQSFLRKKLFSIAEILARVAQTVEKRRLLVRQQ